DRPDETHTGGSLGRLHAFRSQTPDPAQAQLGPLPVSIASQVNAPTALGVDMCGTPGGSLVAFGAPGVDADPNNTGSGALSVSGVDGSQ
ncbi:flagellar hook-associated protein FlgK, partial [Burkholderia pseudomallei]